MCGSGKVHNIEWRGEGNPRESMVWRQLGEDKDKLMESSWSSRPREKWYVLATAIAAAVAVTVIVRKQWRPSPLLSNFRSVLIFSSICLRVSSCRHLPAGIFLWAYACGYLPADICLRVSPCGHIPLGIFLQGYRFGQITSGSGPRGTV
ncbi:hypothetical protein DFH07DRAFT_942900 [Mycena maculata]|uniref:Uncharacterized protein n=1 Tax=Mycena maculata TaxID=230809 RepID=A0AAD7N4E2_9AGAR|nr:hypothetical protein DFH07DRAFT_942900 [Mycena maculata]